MGFLSQALLRQELFEMDRSLKQCYIQGTTRICSTKLAAYNSYLFEAVILTKRHRDDGIGRGNEHEKGIDTILEEQELRIEDERRAMANWLAYTANQTSAWVVKDLIFSFFRERLVEHVQIEFNKPLGSITWPKRNRLPEPVPLQEPWHLPFYKY
jgi:hypothetical protein